MIICFIYFVKLKNIWFFWEARCATFLFDGGRWTTNWSWLAFISNRRFWALTSWRPDQGRATPRIDLTVTVTGSLLARHQPPGETPADRRAVMQCAAGASTIDSSAEGRACSLLFCKTATTSGLVGARTAKRWRGSRPCCLQKHGNRTDLWQSSGRPYLGSLPTPFLVVLYSP
jgi:hypothetical protein